MADFEIKRDWPVLAGGAALVGGAILLLGAKSTQGGAVVTPSNNNAAAVAEASLQADTARRDALSGVFSSYLDYLANKDSIAASEYETYVMAVSHNFEVSQSTILGQSDIYSRQQAYEKSLPSGWDKLWADVMQAAQLYFGAKSGYGTPSSSYPGYRT